MGLGMPKFIVNGYNNFKDTCHDIREGWRATKLIFNLVRKLDLTKVSQTRNPEDFLDAVKNTEDLPDSFKNLLSSVDSDSLKAMVKIASEAFNKYSNNPSEPVQRDQTISKMADVLADSKIKEEQMKDQESLDRLEVAAREHANSLRKNNVKSEDSSSTDNYTTKVEDDKFHIQNKSKNMSDQTADNDDDGYIPSQTQKSIFNMTKKEDDKDSTEQKSNESRRPFEKPLFRTAKEYQEYTKRKPQTDSTENANPSTKNIPPLTKFLGEELEKRFGTSWRNNVPPFMKNPHASPIPDLGLGLNKESNKDMVLNMSRVLKDLL